MAGTPRDQRELLQARGSEGQPVLLGDNDDDAWALNEEDAETGDIIQRRNRFRPGTGRANPISVEDEDEGEDEGLGNLRAEAAFQEEIDRIDLTGNDDEQDDIRSRARHPLPQRNASLAGTHSSAQAHTFRDVKYKVDQFIELTEAIGHYRYSFVKVKSIWVHSTTGETIIRGLPYARARTVYGRLPRKQNEVCLIIEIDQDDDRPDQVLVEVRPQQVLRTDRILAITNQAFPKCRFDPVVYSTEEEREEKGPLVCRWKMELRYRDSRYRGLERPCDTALIHLMEEDVPKIRYRGLDDDKLKAWRGGKIRGGSHIPNGINVDGQSEGRSLPGPGQQYTVVDCFCGAGGYSRGATMAGLKVTVGVDHWEHSCKTYERNFPRGTRLYKMDIFDFIADAGIDIKADILHISPPCQFWSPAHTIEGQNDDDNIAALFSCTELIRKIKARLFTLEQTFGLGQDRHSPFFNALIEGFTRHGYSIRWKIVSLVHWSLPQTRRRLIMIGSCPGEKLPSWPEDTHSDTPRLPGQKQFVSIRQAIRNIRPHETMHNINRCLPMVKVPYEGNAPLGLTITCGGGGAYHYSGLRGYTLAELAALQGFPRDHQFAGKYIKKQIGNAFPPCVVKVLLSHLKKSLEESDGVSPTPPLEGLVDLTRDDEPAARLPSATIRPERLMNVKNEDINGTFDEEQALKHAIQQSAALAGVSQSREVVMLDDGYENSISAGRRLATVAASRSPPPVRRIIREEFMGGMTDAEALERAILESTRLDQHRMDVIDWQDVIDDVNDKQSPTKGIGSRALSEASSATIGRGGDSRSPIKRKFEGFDEPGESSTPDGNLPNSKRSRMFEDLEPADMPEDKLDKLEENQSLQDAIMETIKRSPAPAVAPPAASPAARRPVEYEDVAEDIPDASRIPQNQDQLVEEKDNLAPVPEAVQDEEDDDIIVVDKEVWSRSNQSQGSRTMSQRERTAQQQLILRDFEF